MEKLKGYIDDYIDLGFITDVVNDVDKAKYYVIGSAGVALALGFFWMIIMKMCVACITWTVIFLIMLLAAGLTYVVYLMYEDKKKKIDALADDVEKPRNYYEYIFYVCVVLLVLLYCFICCNYKKIKIVIRIMETAADFVTEVWSVMLVPPLNMIFFFLWVIVWVFTGIYVLSYGDFE